MEYTFRAVTVFYFYFIFYLFMHFFFTLEHHWPKLQLNVLPTRLFVGCTLKHKFFSLQSWATTTFHVLWCSEHCVPFTQGLCAVSHCLHSCCWESHGEQPLSDLCPIRWQPPLRTLPFTAVVGEQGDFRADLKVLKWAGVGWCLKDGPTWRFQGMV